MIWLGIAALVAAGVGAYMAWSSNSKFRQISGTETSTAADLRAMRDSAGKGAFRQRCEITGQVLPHKNGSLRSSLAGEECVWHRHKITRKYEETYRDGQGDRRKRTHTEVTAEQSTSTAFFVQDATGRTVVHPGNQEITGAEKVVDRFDTSHNDNSTYVEFGPIRFNLSGRDRTVGFKQEEWIVRPGSPFYVLGEARANAGRGLSVGKPSDGGAFVLSVKTEDSLRRGELFKSLGFGLGAVAAAVGGVVLLTMSILG